jgi:serine/threonine protein kinase
LTCDLPAFDSIWLDALVQIGRLTPFQAKLLESAQPGRIRIGPCIAIGRLGSGPWGETLLARPHDGDQLCVIKLLNSSAGFSEETIERLHKLVQGVKGFEHPSLVAPASCAGIENAILLISRYVPGLHLGELLVRRGRFPAAVVQNIGRQLADGLAALAERGIAHGDIRAANVRLTSAGTAVLVDAGIRPAIDPVLTVHSGMSPERYDGIAPELIGVGGVPSQATDAYALGCLLWQLLAGRPPFPGGDPLVKLASHQTRTIDDVRKWAPDTPDVLAEGIRRLTAREACARPQSFSQLLNAWGEPGRKCRSELATFRRRFDAPSRNRETHRGLSAPTRWLLLFAALFAVSGGVLTLNDNGARNVALAWAAQFSQRLSRSTESLAPADSTPDSTGDVDNHQSEMSVSSVRLADEQQKPAAFGLPMPAPDRHGVVHLDAAGPYRAGDITTVGELAIVGADGTRPQILIEDQPVTLCAESLRLKNVRFGFRSSGSARPSTSKALLRVHAQELFVDDCVFEGGGGHAVSPAGEAEQNTSQPVVAPTTGPASIAWKLLDASEQHGGRATIRNTLLLGDGPGLYLVHAVKYVEFSNVLKIGPGPLIQLAGVPGPKAQFRVRLTHTTCRASGALLRWIVTPEGTPRGRIVVEAGDCVFDVVSPQAALFELAGAPAQFEGDGSQPGHPEWLKTLRLTGEGSLTRPGLEVAAWVSTIDGQVRPLEGSALEVEGLYAGEFRFAGESNAVPADSEVHDAEAPRRSSEPPGINATVLPIP